jgi:cytochrome c peroxidase
MSRMALLGQQMFLDTALSESGNQSCETCHDSAYAFAGNPTNDSNTAAGVAMGGPTTAHTLQGLRNSPALTYTIFAPAFFFDTDATPTGGFFRDGRASTLADQAAGPFTNPFEMANASNDAVLAKLKTRPYYNEFLAVFGAGAATDGDTAMKNMALAIQQYEKEEPLFKQFNSKYDAYLAGKAQLTTQELNGLAIFNNPAKGNCMSCHVSAPTAATPALFTDFTYDNIGVPRNWAINANQNPYPYTGVTGYPDANGKALDANGDDYYDLGLCGPLRTDLATHTGLCGAFRVPSLRNIALTAPYFHNGYAKTLEEAVAFYITRDSDPNRWYRDASGNPDAPYNDLPEIYKSNVNKEEVPYIPSLAPTLTASEMSDLVHFLCTLTDGYDPANPAAYNVPQQCNSTAATMQATLDGAATGTAANP